MTVANQVNPNPKITLDRIAVLTDFSTYATNGLRFAARLARNYSSSLTLVHAYPAPSLEFPSPNAKVILGQDPNALGESRGVAERQMADQVNELSSRGIPVKAILREGSVLRILEEVNDADLLVVGTAGRSGLKKALMGSTAETVFRVSKVPVLTIGPRCIANELGIGPLTTMLFATEHPVPPEAALPYALSLAQDHDARLLILHVEPEEAAPFSFDKAMSEAAHLKQLRKMVPVDVYLWCRPEFSVAFGEVAETILEKAKEFKADLIVMGAKRAGAFPIASSHLGGGTAYRVASEASCPVLTIRS